MVFLVLLFIALIIAFTFLKTKNVIHPIIIFCSLWFCIIFLASLKLYDMVDISFYTYLLVFTGILSFLLGNIISIFIKKYQENNEEKDIKQINKFRINWKFANLILLISLSGMVILFLVSLKYLIQGYSFSQIHNMFYAYNGMNKMLPEFLDDYVVWIALPCLYVSVFTTLIGIFEKDIKKVYIFGTMLSMLFYLFGNASRILIIIFLISIIVLLFYYKKNIPKKMKKRFKLICFFAFLVFLFFTIVRTNESTNNSVNSLYAYLSIPIALFDYWVNSFNIMNLDYAYGGGFFFGFISWINWFIEKIGYELPIYSLVSNYVISTQNVWVSIFPSKRYNAFCSIFYYFYFDFGIAGIIIGSMIFGYVSHSIYYKAIIKNNKKYLLFYLLVLQCILFSFVRWEFGTASFVVEIIAAKLITSKLKIK